MPIGTRVPSERVIVLSAPRKRTPCARRARDPVLARRIAREPAPHRAAAQGVGALAEDQLGGRVAGGDAAVRVDHEQRAVHVLEDLVVIRSRARAGAAARPPVCAPATSTGRPSRRSALEPALALRARARDRRSRARRRPRGSAPARAPDRRCSRRAACPRRARGCARAQMRASRAARAAASAARVSWSASGRPFLRARRARPQFRLRCCWGVAHSTPSRAPGPGLCGASPCFESLR